MLDFLVFELGDSVVLSVADSLLGDFSVLASDFFELLFFSVVLLFSAALLVELVLFDEGLVALSAAGLLVAGLFVVVDDFVEAEGLTAGTGLGFTLALAAGVMVAPTDAVAAGVIVAPTLAAGVALALVEAAVLVVPVVVAPVVVVPLVEVTPTLKLGVTP